MISDLGEVRPFGNIVKAAQRHIDALLALFEKYAVAPHANRWTGRVPRFDSVQAACTAGVKAEMDNMAVYDRVFKTRAHEDILAGSACLGFGPRECRLRIGHAISFAQQIGDIEPAAGASGSSNTG